MTTAAEVLAAGTRFGGRSLGLVGLVIALLFGFICSSIARGKGRGGVLWFILGFLFHIITLIVVLILPRRRDAY